MLKDSKPYVPWNKNLTLFESDKIKECALKSQTTRAIGYFRKCLDAMNLRDKGLSIKQVAEELNCSQRNVFHRLKRYWEILEDYESDIMASYGEEVK